MCSSRILWLREWIKIDKFHLAIAMRFLSVNSSLFHPPCCQEWNVTSRDQWDIKWKSAGSFPGNIFLSNKRDSLGGDKRKRKKKKACCRPFLLLPIWNMDVMPRTKAATSSPWSNAHDNEEQYAYQVRVWGEQETEPWMAWSDPPWDTVNSEFV